MPYAVVFAPEADVQLEALYHYIAAQASPSTAERYTSAVVDACESLGLFPKRGVAREDIRLGLRVTHQQPMRPMPPNIEALRKPAESGSHAVPSEINAAIEWLDAVSWRKGCGACGLARRLRHAPAPGPAAGYASFQTARPTTASPTAIHRPSCTRLPFALVGRTDPAARTPGDGLNTLTMLLRAPDTWPSPAAPSSAPGSVSAPSAASCIKLTAAARRSGDRL